MNHALYSDCIKSTIYWRDKHQNKQTQNIFLGINRWKNVQSFFKKQCKWKDIGLPGIVRWNTSDAFENHSMEKIKLFGNNMIERKYICMSNFGGIMLWETCQIFKKMRRKGLSTLAHNTLEIMLLFLQNIAMDEMLVKYFKRGIN